MWREGGRERETKTEREGERATPRPRGLCEDFQWEGTLAACSYQDKPLMYRRHEEIICVCVCECDCECACECECVSVSVSVCETPHEGQQHALGIDVV